ncbi:hypothetical protein EDB83DRAFT_2324396 [Lactarius deliciosus]|nr:hypothetical protein EDB83DRAFT_2324396 [Lactarius deliciosus]
MGNGGIGGFADNGVGGTGSEREGQEATLNEEFQPGPVGKCQCALRSILEKAVIVATREFFDSVAGKKAGHETQATTTNPNASRIPLREWLSCLARAGMLERHRSIPGVASEVCRRAATSGVPDERELEEGRPFEDNTPRTSRKDTIVEARM